MSKPDPHDRRLIKFEQLNLLGKSIFLTGAAIRTTASIIDRVLEKAADVVVEAEIAFKRELDPNMEDAKILDEHPGKENA